MSPLSAPSTLIRSTSQLYRDCLRLIKHIAGKSSTKSIKLIKIVKTEFLKSSKEADEKKIELLKSNAIRGLANYMMIEAANSNKDKRFQNIANSYNQKEAQSINNKNNNDNDTKLS